MHEKNRGGKHILGRDRRRPSDIKTWEEKTPQNRVVSQITEKNDSMVVGRDNSMKHWREVT